MFSFDIRMIYAIQHMDEYPRDNLFFHVYCRPIGTDSWHNYYIYEYLQDLYKRHTNPLIVLKGAAKDSVLLISARSETQRMSVREKKN